MSRATGRGLVVAALAAAALALPAAPPAGAPAVARLVAVGDIGTCEGGADEAVAALVARLPGTIALLGDTVYDSGTAEEYRDCFLPAWRPLLPRAHAALGNHEYANGDSDAAAAKAVFGLRRSTWYGYDAGRWHVVVLDSNCDIVGCAAGSAQWRWLRSDLVRHPTLCTLAYWHHPRFSSGLHGSDARLAPLWGLLARAHAELVLSGHDHDYERLAPIDGIRSFVVGTGGKSLYPIVLRRAGSEAAQSTTYGVLRLTLRPTGYDWRFARASGPPFTDAGTGSCRR